MADGRLSYHLRDCHIKTSVCRVQMIGNKFENKMTIVEQMTVNSARNVKPFVLICTNYVAHCIMQLNYLYIWPQQF